MSEAPLYSCPGNKSTFLSRPSHGALVLFIKPTLSPPIEESYD